MSCIHGNHPNNCEICDEAETSYVSGYNDGKTKPWVGLTDEERHACTQSPFTAENYRAIEAKLKEKNNG